MMRTVLAATALAASGAAAQPCTPEWAALAGGGFNSSARSLAVFDGGSGPALYAGGTFTTAGGITVNRMAQWRPAITSWSPLGSGMNNTVEALAVFDDGGGPALYAGGWFTDASGVPANGIASWDGQSWSPLGAGIAGPFGPAVYALEVFDDGGGSALYAGGPFDTAGGAPASRIARWDGQSWSALGSGTNSSVNALAVFDDGGGPALYAGGTFETAGGAPANSIARWDGQSWSPLGAGTIGAVRALAVFYDGAGPALYAGGEFISAGGGVPGTSRIARWDGQKWSALGSGMSDFAVWALGVFDDGSGAALYAAGDFPSAGGVPGTSRIAKWDGRAWSPLQTGMNIGTVLALTVFDDGGGPALYAAGGFTGAGGVPAERIARWGCPPRPPCYADCDGSGTLNIDDFLCFQLAFALQDPYADCDGNSVFNIDDFLCFQLAFALGCE